MPVVPTFEREDLPAIQPTGPQEDIQAAGIPGDAVARLGQAATDALVTHLQQENYDYVASNLADAREKWTSQFLSRSQAATKTGSYDAFTPQFTGDMGADLQQRISNAPTPRAADALKKSFSTLQDEFTQKAASFQGLGNETNWTAHTKTNLATIATIPLRDPSQTDSVYAEGLGIINGGLKAGLAQGALADMGQQWANQVYGAEVQNGIENNPAKAAADLRSGKYDRFISEENLLELQKQADDAARVRNAEAQRQATENAMLVRGSVDGAYQDNLASITDTGKPAVPLTRAMMAAAYPREPDRVNALQASLDQATAGYVAKQKVALSGPDEDAATLSSLKPGGAGYTEQAQTYNAVLAAVQAKNKALEQDPAAYVQNVSPQVRAAFQAATQDPGKLPQAVALQDATYDRLGLPADARPVLPQQQAAAIVARFTSADPTKIDVGGQLDQLATVYGPAWPRVFSDLVQAKLPPSYEMLATMDTPEQLAGRQDMQRALVTAAAKGGPQALEEMAPPAASVAIKAGLPDELAAFRATAAIPGASANVGLLGKVRDAVSMLAHFYAVQGQDGPTALGNAYDAVLGDKYDFDGTLRVPKGMLPQVRAATASALATIRPAELQAAAGLPPGIASDRWVSARQNSAWYPTQKDDGVMLMVQTRDGRWNRVLRANGVPVTLKFSDIRNAPAPEPDASPDVPSDP